MLKGITLLVLLPLVLGNQYGLYGGAADPFDVWQFTQEFMSVFNRLMKNKRPPQNHFFPPLFPEKNSAFKTMSFNDMRPGAKKVFKIDNGQGIAFRSKDGNAGGMSFSSGPGDGFSFGGTFGGPGKGNGEFVMSQSGNGRSPKVTYSNKPPAFAKNLFSMFGFRK